MRIDSIQFKNIFAYGEKLNEVSYTGEGRLILLKGKSGSGKSAIMSLPVLALYGKAGDMPKSAIANRINKNGLVIAKIHNNGHEYVIERGFSPNTLKISKDGKDLENFGSRDAQDYINNEITDIPEKAFNGILSISMKDFKGFLKMKTADRKAIIDNIFSLGAINKAYDLIKADARELSNNVNSFNSSIFSMTNILSSTMIQLENIQKKSKNDENSAQIEKNLQEIEKLRKSIETISSQQEQVKAKEKECSAKMAESMGIIGKLDSEIYEIQKKISLFSQDKCPTCGTSFNSENFQDLKTRLNDLLELKKSAKAEQQKTIDSYKEFLSKVNNALQQLSTSFSSLQTEIMKLSSQNAALNESLKKSNEHEALLAIIDNTQKEIEKAKAGQQKISFELKMLQKLLLVFSIDGIKEKVIEKYMPMINKEIRTNLERLNFPYQLMFDSHFEPVLTDLNQTIQVETLSDGEMTRVELVVLCALLKILKFKFPSINMFHLDETISTLDVETGCIVLKFLKDFAKDTGLNIIVVTHVDVSQENFDELIEVQRTRGFSEITTTQIS